MNQPHQYLQQVLKKTMRDVAIKREEIIEDSEGNSTTGKCSIEDSKGAKDDDQILRKLCSASKKISKNKAIERQNAEKFVEFFEKWKQLKKSDINVKKHTKFWFSSFNKELNKTYIYRDFFGNVRIHFRLAINEKNFNFGKVSEADWPKLFLNLTDYLRNEIFELENTISKEKKSIVVPVWIDSLDSFRIESKHKLT